MLETLFHVHTKVKELKHFSVMVVTPKFCQSDKSKNTRIETVSLTLSLHDQPQIKSIVTSSKQFTGNKEINSVSKKMDRSIASKLKGGSLS